MARELLCPRCKNPASEHYVISFQECELTTPQAEQLAQEFQKAVRHCQAIVKKRNAFKRPTVGWNRYDNMLWSAIAAYRAIGIFKQEAEASDDSNL